MSETDGRAPDETHEASRDAAGRIGGALGRLVRVARRTAAPGPERDRLVEQARATVDAARPRAERLAQQARAAADAARPHVERAARQAVQYTRDHQQTIRHLASIGAIEATRRAIPYSLRPIAAAVESELLRGRPITTQPADGTRSPSEDAGHAQDTPDTEG